MNNFRNSFNSGAGYVAAGLIGLVLILSVCCACWLVGNIPFMIDTIFNNVVEALATPTP